MPPVEDEELIQRIRATNARDTANGLSTWTCRRCKKGLSETPSAVSSRELTASSDSRGDRKSLTSSYYSPAVTDITTSTVQPERRLNSRHSCQTGIGMW
ncbi:hypothetical protein J3R83DRAFT_12792 [Lanmaoa asiatica]|nr:hypothetical protein J3R83DRAFT_12792 [Lanmaoa asiatica]